MARLGIDFGTTNTVAILHDRGILSEVLHTARTGVGDIVQDVFPSAILIDRTTGERWFGIEADRRFGRLGASDRYLFIPSLKRCLRDYADGRTIDAASGNSEDKSEGVSKDRSEGDAAGGSEPNCEDDSGAGSARVARLDVAELLCAFLEALADSIRRSRSLASDEPLEAVITWPANANGAQRYITRRCFREAGFRVLDTINEPTASAIELADCLGAGRRVKPLSTGRALAVFDLGGGTFDASVVWAEDKEFRVLASGGIEDLGGDDFDQMLLDMFLEAMRPTPDRIAGLTQQALLRQARAQKETISSGIVRSLVLNPADFGLAGRPVSIRVTEYVDRLRPRIEPAVGVLRRVIEKAAAQEPRVKTAGPLTIYMVGGSSKLPVVGEMLAAAFPNDRVILTDKPFMSVAMGAAVCAVEMIGYRDVFSRHFGIIRLRDHGRAETFDTIFPAGTPIPRRGEPPLEKLVRYHPQHNLGRLRYLECAEIGPDGMPRAGTRAWSDIIFPYDPALSLSSPLGDLRIVPTDRFSRDAVCEVYRCDSDGVITVELQRPTCQDRRTHEVYRD